MKEELLKELKEAMREKNTLKKDTITMLRAAILQVEKDGQKELNENEMEVIVSKEVKKRKESIEEFKKADRLDLVEGLNLEIEILSKYLPQQLSKEEVEVMIKTAIEKTGATTARDMGKVMGMIKADIAGKADGKMVSDLVKEMLS